MTKNDDSSPVFIIRIWREHHDKPGEAPELRGEIEHLQSKEKAYFRELQDVILFINHYLEEIGLAQAATRKNNDFFQKMIAALQGKRPNE